MPANPPFPNLELEDRIDHYLKGSLRHDQVDALWVDLIESGSVDYLKTTATVRKIAMESPRVVPIPLAPRKRLRTMAAAAAAVFVLGLGGSWFWSASQPRYALEPLARIEYDLVRSGAPEAAPQGDRHRAATELAAVGDFAGALALLQEPATSDERMLLGTILYNSARFGEALAVFSELAGTDGLPVEALEKASWFAGNAAWQIGDTEAARTWIRKTIELDGAYRRPAQRMESHLSR